MAFLAPGFGLASPSPSHDRHLGSEPLEGSSLSDLICLSFSAPQNFRKALRNMRAVFTFFGDLSLIAAVPDTVE